MTRDDDANADAHSLGLPRGDYAYDESIARALQPRVAMAYLVARAAYDDYAMLLRMRHAGIKGPRDVLDKMTALLCSMQSRAALAASLERATRWHGVD